MNVMVVDDGEGDLFFLCQALEALGAKILHSPSLDEDKVLTHHIEAVVHVWSPFTVDVETVQIQNLKEVDPKLVVTIFARAEDVAFLRRKWPRELVADRRTLAEAPAARTAEAMVREVRLRRPVAAAGST